MSDQNLEQYQLDLSGINPDNLIENESHTLVRQRNRAVALHHGAFFSESLVIKHVDSDYILRHHIDYKILQPYSTLIAATGKSVAGIILIHNTNVHQHLAITYQCVGGDFGITSKSLEGYLNSISDQGTTFSWYNSLIEDKSFQGESPSIDKFDFHWLCFTLEKIRNAIIWSDSEYYDKIRSYLDSVIDSVEIQTKLALDNYLNVHFENFKSNVTKTTIGLSNIQNLGTTSSNEIIEASQPGSRITQFEFNKYLTLQSLAVFKEELYKKFSLSSTTNIGLDRGVIIAPSIEAVISMVNGGIALLRSKQANTDDTIAYDGGVYPPSSGIDEEFTILKVSGNVANDGGIYLYSERSGKSLYMVYHSNGNPNSGFVWNKLTTSEDTATISQDIADHLLDFNNPHNKTKESVGFNRIENLPVVSREKILNLQSCREYLTMDGLLLFTKTHMVDKEAAAVDPRNDDRDAVQIIYTAQAEDKCLPPDCPCPDVTPTPPPPVVDDPPLLVKINQFINSIVNENVNIQPSTNYSEYYNLVNSDFPPHSVIGEYGYSDGSTGFEHRFLQVIKENSVCAGYHPGNVYGTVALTPGGIATTTGHNGVSVTKGDSFQPTIEILPDELYSNKEYIAFIKMPGRIPHYIRGVIPSTGIAPLPVENFGYESFHTGSSSAIANMPAIFTAVPLDTNTDNRLNDTSLQFTNTLSIGTVRSNGSVDPYVTVLPSIYLTLRSHITDENNILNATLVIYNVPMTYDNGTGTYLTDYDINYQLIYLEDYNSIGYQIDGTSSQISEMIEVPNAVTNKYGVGAVEVMFNIDISTLQDGYNLIKLVLNTENGFSTLNAESHLMQVYKAPTKTILTKTIPVFIDNVQSGTITISRDSHTQELKMSPFNSVIEYPNENLLSIVYYFEKDVTGDTDPFVYLTDVFYDQQELVKPNSETIETFSNSNFVNFNSDHTFEFMAQSEYNQIIENLEKYKIRYLEEDKNQFTKYHNSKSLTVEQFNSITKVRMVKYSDPNYACLVLPEILRPPDLIFEIPVEA